MNYPRMIYIRQHFDMPIVRNLASLVQSEMAKMQLVSIIKAGDSVAIPVGSRGICNIAEIVASVVRELNRLGAKPFIVPAMGSHGGGTASGQEEMLASLGVDATTVGAPVRSSMEVVRVGTTEQGIPVFFDRAAHEADHVAVINRVKLHTRLTGEIQSGLHKMLLIGLGKHIGAQEYHRAFTRHRFDHIARSVGESVIQRCNICFGLAVVENARGETGLIRAVRPKDFYAAEVELLALARQWMPRLPFDQADLLIVDEMGKDISGAGMDTNVIGRKQHEHQFDPEGSPQVGAIYVRDLTQASHGNATGIGKAEFTHSRLIDKIDLQATYINCITATAPASAGIPIHFDSDQKVLSAARTVSGVRDPARERWIRIKNTEHLQEVWVSEAYQEQLGRRRDLEALRGPVDILFDDQGDFVAW